VSLLPYAALVVGYGLLAIRTGSAWTSELGSLIVGGIALSGLVVARQVIAVRESEARKQQLLDYVEQVGYVTAAAAAVELGRFDPESLTGVAARPDALGQLARVFQNMAREVQTREQRLKQEVQDLRIELDKGAVGRQVSEITETDYFQDLKKKAAQLRSRPDVDR
jgi:DNA repair ATPase RecN